MGEWVSFRVDPGRQKGEGDEEGDGPAIALAASSPSTHHSNHFPFPTVALD